MENGNASALNAITEPLAASRSHPLSAPRQRNKMQLPGIDSLTGGIWPRGRKSFTRDKEIEQFNFQYAEEVAKIFLGSSLDIFAVN
jgi:hypothetical protein